MTVGHLLAHTSGIGDYLDEAVIEGIDDYVLPVPAHHLASTTDYLAVLRGHPAKFEAGERFEYCNGGRHTGACEHSLGDEVVISRGRSSKSVYDRANQLSA